MAQVSAITLRQLRAFVAVAEEGSIVRAAQRLHLTASALSMLLSALEGEVGIRLLERTTRRMVLTDAGQTLLPCLLQTLANLDTALIDVQALSQRRGSLLRIATSPLMAATLLPPLLASFRTGFPEIVPVLNDVSVDEVARFVRAGDADIGICTEDVKALDLQSRVLFQDRLVLACPPDHALADKPEVRWRDLAGEPLILMGRDTGLRSLTERGLSTLGELTQPAFEVKHVTTAIALVEAGLGISVLPSYALARAPTATVRSVALVDPIVERAIVALSAPERPLFGAAEAFLAHFQQNALWGGHLPHQAQA